MVVQETIYHHRFIVTVIAGCVVSMLSFTISVYDIETNIAVGLGSFISTLAAFRWVWSTRYSWEYYLISIRPLFQTVSYIFVILGPLFALSGMPRYMYFPGAIDYYWYLYLAAPLAFIFYEFGYECSLRKITNALYPISVKTLAINSNITTFTLYIYILLFFTYFSTIYGINQAGITGLASEEGFIIKALSYLYDGLFGVCLFLITIKWLNNDSKGNWFLLIMGLTLFSILVLCNSRTKTLTISIMCLVAVQISKNNKFYEIIKYIFIIPILFILTTAIRQSSIIGQSYNAGKSITERVKLAGEALQDQGAEERTKQSITTDYGYRINGIEWAGAMIHSHYTFGTPFLWGKSFFWGAYQAVPERFLPFPKINPAMVSNLNFKLPLKDPCGSIFASAVADAGPLGIIIVYFAIGFFNGTLWCYAASQKTPQYAKLAYLALIPALMYNGGNIGSYIFINIRSGILYAIIFGIIITVGKLFLPPTHYKNKKNFINKHLLETNRKLKKAVQTK